jgi:hypothetical protein
MLQALREGIPKINIIWEISQANLLGRDDKFQEYLWFDDHVRKGLADGSLNEDSQVLPSIEELPMTFSFMQVVSKGRSRFKKDGGR